MRHSPCISLILVLILASIGNAQLIKAVGAKVAYTSSYQDFRYTNFSVTTQRRSGINAAVFLEWLNSPYVSIVSQAEYAQRGMVMRAAITLNDPTPVGYVDLDNRVDYLSVPILVKLMLPLDSVTPYLIAGPRYDVLLGFHSDRSGFDAVYNDFKHNMLGFSVGGGVSTTAFFPYPLIVEFRYNADLGDSYATPLLTVRNEAFDVWLGVAF
jgi:opacity protein-like surface antigen